MSAPLTEADLIFPHQSNTPNLSTTLSSLRRSTLSIHNRLSSIISDSDFVTSAAAAYNLPLVANERCGSWYIPPSLKSSSVYFKSTDGHMGEWRFSLRRLNLQLLDVVEKWGGAVVVDSTRRGKSMPDALSKTVPIWCCVMNRAVFGDGDGGKKHELFTPPQVVSESEHAQIERRVEGFVRQFLDICKPNIPFLRAKLQKPLRPLWVTQQSSLPDSPPSFPDFHPIVLCTASRRVRGAEASENGYIQGAADDHEAWAHKLTPTLFWANKALLLGTSEENASDVIEKLLSEQQSSGTVPTLIKPTSNLYISSSESRDLTGFDVVISCTPTPFPSALLKNAGIKESAYLHLVCQTGKPGSRDLRVQLPRLLSFLSALPDLSSSKILVCCPTGKDLSVGTALAILCLHINETGRLVAETENKQTLDKTLIKQRLSWITTSNPSLNPSRATLQSVNAVVFESRDGKTTTVPIRPAISSPTTEPESENSGNGTQNPGSSPDEKGADVPTRIFNALSTTPWSFTRTLTSTLPTHPSGSVTGTARFTRCTNLPASFPPTLLYAEEGEFVTDTGLKFSARRKYVYQLKNRIAEDEEDGKGGGKDEGKEKGKDGGNFISVSFFADDAVPRSSTSSASSGVTGVGEKGEGIGSLFVEMGSLTSPPSSNSSENGVLVARNKEQHLCAEDLYTASWEFGHAMAGKIGGGDGEGERDMWWQVRYDVKGPKKDYVSVTRYARA